MKDYSSLELCRSDTVQCSGDIREAYGPLVPVLSLSGRRNLVWRICDGGNFGLQLKAKKCTFMQTEVVFLGHIFGRTGLGCDPAKLVAVRNWHAPDKVKGVRQFVGFVGYYRRFVKDFAELVEPLVAFTRKGSHLCGRTDTAFEALKAFLVCAPILGFPTEDGCFVLDTDASLFAVGGVLGQLQKGEVVIPLLAVKCWRQSLCELISDHILEENSLHLEQITVCSVGSRDSGTETECWLAGIYC